MKEAPRERGWPEKTLRLANLSYALRRCWYNTLIGSMQATGYAGGLDYFGVKR